jgi:hypothetical protein
VDWIQLDPVADSREHGNETSGFVKDGEFLEWLLKWARRC